MRNLKLTHNEFVILQWIGSVNTRTLRATAKRPLGWNERCFYNVIEIGWVNFNPRTGRTWLTEHGRRIYNRYVAPTAERRKEEIRVMFESMTNDYSPQHEQPQDSLDPIEEDIDGEAERFKEQTEGSEVVEDGRVRQSDSTTEETKETQRC